eukprot:gene7611-766_t
MEEAVRKGSVLDRVTEIYTQFQEDTNCAGPSYWRWFQEHLGDLERDLETPHPEDLVRIVGLTKDEGLNGVVGVFLALDSATGRARVRIKKPPSKLASAQSKEPIVVCVKMANLKGYQLGVMLCNRTVLEVKVPLKLAGEPQEGKHGMQSWKRCDVPNMLGLKLALLPLAPGLAPSLADERYAFFLLVDPISGLVTTQLAIQGLGPALVARVVNQDFTKDDFLDLNEYNEYLMDCWPEWTSASDADRLRRRLSPDMFATFNEMKLMRRTAEVIKTIGYYAAWQMSGKQIPA